MKRLVGLRVGLAFAVILALAVTYADEPRAEAPVDYPLDYPAAGAFCLPVRTYVADVVQTVQEVDGQVYRHMPNGGYGLPIQIQVAGKYLIHLGADVAWNRAGEPVFAIADGVVRMSQG